MAHLRGVWSNGKIKTRREKSKKFGEPAPTPIHLSQISYEITWD
jgi:hypothetical protein